VFKGMISKRFYTPGKPKGRRESPPATAVAPVPQRRSPSHVARLPDATVIPSNTIQTVKRAEDALGLKRDRVPGKRACFFQPPTWVGWTCKRKKLRLVCF
jgi:hypothetical protein